MKTIKIKPLADRVIVEPGAGEKMTKSGIIIPDTAQSRSNKGTVISIGTNKDLVVKEGDNVMFGQNSGIEIEIEGKKYLIMREAEIFAII